MTKKLALDGPSASGKSTIAKILAQKLKLSYLDTGALYRGITLALMQAQIDLNNEEDIKKYLNKIELNFVDGKLYLADRDISSLIRGDEVTKNVSLVSAYPSVRDHLLYMQRHFSDKDDVILDGRDIGTVVLPDADLKIFLTASDKVRALRRLKDEKSSSKMTFEEILADLKRRDLYDSSRKTAPLKKAEDAIEIDSSDLSIDQVVQLIIDKWSKL